LLTLFSILFTFAHETAAASPHVQFDAAYAVACRDASPPEFREANPHQRLIEARLEVSTLLKSGSDDDLAELYYRFTSPHRTLEISDYLPKTTLATDIAGNIAYEEKSENSASFGISLAGAYFHAAKAGLDAGVGSKSGKTVRYEKLPPLDSVTASGTIQRGTGVYFKLRPSTRTTLEGGTEFVLLLRVPAEWRADYLQLDCQAAGWRRGPVRALDERANCGGASFSIALHLEGDEEARTAALEFVAAENRLRRAAAEISQPRNSASLADRLGLFGGGSEMALPEDWLERILAFPAEREGRYLLSRLPAPVRDTAIRYLAAHKRLAALNSAASARSAAAPLHAALER
jgi:hypothetical protein